MGFKTKLQANRITKDHPSFSYTFLTHLNLTAQIDLDTINLPSGK